LPFYYDVNRITATAASGGTEASHLAMKTAANQETVGISGLYVSGRGGTAGGATVRLKHNTGTVYSGGTAQTPAPRNLRGAPAAQLVVANDATAITAGTTLVQRLSIGFAQTGGMGGWVATEPTAKVQMMPNTTNPVDVEVTSIANGATLPIEITLEFGEGV
jgi:hypothetical protein